MLVDGASLDLSGVWSLLYAAQRAALRLALDAGLDRDLSLTLAATDLGEALEELEWHHHDLPAGAAALDLGPIPAGATKDCLRAIEELLWGALDRGTRMLPRRGESPPTPDAVCLLSNGSPSDECAEPRAQPTAMTPPILPVTYGGLMHAAGRHVDQAAVALSQQRIPDPVAARATIATYWTLLATMHRHAWLLSGGPQRMAGVTASASPSRLDSAAAELIDILAAASKLRSPSGDAARTKAGRSWAKAARLVDGAGDLLSTHRHGDGGGRTPDAARIESAPVRDAAILGLVDLVDGVLDAQRDLGLRAVQTGIARTELAQLLPDRKDLRTSIRAVRTAGGSDPIGRKILDDLGLARPSVRSGDPLSELGDRILRLRRTAWQLSGESHVGVACLTDIAAAGVIFHTFAAQSRPPAADSTVESRRSAWTLAHLRLRQLRTPTPGLLVVRVDVLGIRDTCLALMTRAGSKLSTRQRAVDPRQHATVIAGGIKAFADIAGSSIRIVDHMSRTEQIYVSGRRLTGDQITDDPVLVEAKLEGQFVLASHNQVQPSIEALEATRGVPFGRPSTEVRDRERQLVIDR